MESLKKLVEEAGALALVGVKEHGVRVTFRLDPSIDRVIADRVQIQQVILNLIRNAIEAMEGLPRRELVISTEPADDHMVAVNIADTGTGPRAGNPAETVRALHQHQGAGHGRRAVDFAHDHRSAWRRDFGEAERGRRHGVPLHAATVKEGEAVDVA